MSIDSQWDHIAEERLMHRMNGDDISYNTVFLPTIKQYLYNFKKVRILDFGCGTGELTFEISKLGFEVIGIDISKHSIELAKRNFSAENLTFINKSLISANFSQYFSIVVANMALMDTEDLDKNLVAIHDSLVDQGKLILIITHPAFWPIYWDYMSDGSFNYLKECNIYKTYKTKTKVFNGFKTTHFHRPIGKYIESFLDANFKICSLKELKNPDDKEWYPRFMFFELEKN